MSTSPEPDFASLKLIADRLQPHQDVLARSWARFFAATVNANEEFSILRRSIAEVNRAIEREIPAIALATGNSERNIMTFRPHGVDSELKVWFDDHNPADFLRCVERYRSFNMSAWKTRGWKGYSSQKATIAEVTA